MTKRPKTIGPDLALVTIRYLGDYYAYPDGDCMSVLLKGDTARVCLLGHWTALVEGGHAEVIDE